MLKAWGHQKPLPKKSQNLCVIGKGHCKSTQSYSAWSSLSNENGLFQDDFAHIHSVQVLSKRFDEDENDENHMLLPSQSPNLNPIWHL